MSSVPQHVAIIMDGNRRWAREHGLADFMGHKTVADKILEPLIEHAAKLGIQYMTFWAWSTENWERRPEEVRAIMEIFRHVIKKRWKRLSDKGVRIRIIGDISKFPEDIRESLEKVVRETKNYKVITTIFALNYGGRDEIIRSVKRLVKDGTANNITREQFTNYLDTKGIPDPDLIIRTGGEKRLSGFLLWQSEYSELYFPSFYMPDFTPERLDEAVREYQRRKRRFGV